MSGGHGQTEGDEIVLHQETLWPTMLLAAVFSVIALFGLSQAGHIKFDVSMGKDAYEKIQIAKPKLATEAKSVPMEQPSVNYKTPDGKTHIQKQLNMATPNKETKTTEEKK